MIDARAFHEKPTKVKRALSLFRTGRDMTEMEWRNRISPGARLPAAVHILRKSHGFLIEGYGSVDLPYYLPRLDMSPTLVVTTGKIQLAYYNSDHWQGIRDVRMRIDHHLCVLCGEGETSLQVHHILYRLFEERTEDLMTVCKDCHENIHANCKMRFPLGMTVSQVLKCNIQPTFAQWLLPGYKFTIEDFKDDEPRRVCEDTSAAAAK